MKPIQTLSQEVNKRIHTCKDCGGAGQVENKNNRIDSNGLSITVDCTTCQGEGYVIPKHLHTLVCNENSFSKEPYNCDGYTLTLQDILRCLRSGTELETDRTRIIIHGEEIVELPFTDPKEWDDKTIKALIKLIK